MNIVFVESLGMCECTINKSLATLRNQGHTVTFYHDRNENEEVLIDYGVSYLKIAGFSYLLTGISQCYLVIMKTSEHAKTTAVISSMTVCVNIILNAIFIFGGFGIAPMGARSSYCDTYRANY